MGLLNLLKKGSLLSANDGATPESYNQSTQYQKGLASSQLDLDGKTPSSYNQITQYEKGLAISQLDLDGKTPTKYTDNLPG
jgi:hypothetical protein